MDQNLKDFIFATFGEAFKFINPNLTNWSEFSRTLSRAIKTKRDQNHAPNVQYNFDVKLDRIFAGNIRKYNISGKYFSEESGWNEWGEKKYIIVYDPFCNSTLASKGF